MFLWVVVGFTYKTSKEQSTQYCYRQYSRFDPILVNIAINVFGKSRTAIINKF